MKVTLKAAHRHNEQDHAAGDEINVGLHDALWLKQHDLVVEGLDAINAEVGKQSKKDQDAYSAALDRAAAAEASRKNTASNVTPIKG